MLKLPNCYLTTLWDLETVDFETDVDPDAAVLGRSFLEAKPKQVQTHSIKILKEPKGTLYILIFCCASAFLEGSLHSVLGSLPSSSSHPETLYFVDLVSETLFLRISGILLCFVFHLACFGDLRLVPSRNSKPCH